GDADRHDADEKSVAGANHQHAEHVPPELVGAQQIAALARTGEAVGNHDVRRGFRRPGERENRGRDHQADQGRPGDHARRKAPHALARMRGSSSRYETSTMKLTTSTTPVSSMTVAWMTIRSRLPMAWSSMRPRPGR